MLCVDHPSQLQKYRADDSLQIREDLYLLGPLEIDQPLRVAGILRSQGNIQVAGSMTVEKNLQADASFKCGGNLDVGGQLISNGAIDVGGSISAGEAIMAASWIKANGSIKTQKSVLSGGSIEAKGEIQAGRFIKAYRHIDAQGPIQTKTWVYSCEYDMQCEYFTSRTLPLNRMFWASLPGLERVRDVALDPEKGWLAWHHAVSDEEKQQVCSLPGLHWILRGHLENFLGLTDRCVPPPPLVDVSKGRLAMFHISND